jgi:hypothetical protein
MGMKKTTAFLHGMFLRKKLKKLLFTKKQRSYLDKSDKIIDSLDKTFKSKGERTRVRWTSRW